MVKGIPQSLHSVSAVRAVLYFVAHRVPAFLYSIFNLYGDYLFSRASMYIMNCDHYSKVKQNNVLHIGINVYWYTKKYHKHYNQVLYIVSRIRVQSNVQLHIGINHLAAAALGDCRCPRRFAP